MISYTAQLGKRAKNGLKMRNRAANTKTRPESGTGKRSNRFRYMVLEWHRKIQKTAEFHNRAVSYKNLSLKIVRCKYTIIFQ